jgi:hypothetical protein
MAPGRTDALLTHLSDAEQVRFGRHRHVLSANQFLIGRVMVRRWLHAVTGTPASAWRLVEGQRGRPEIAHPPSPWAFNLAHSGSLVACVLSKTADVGIDLEDIRALAKLSNEKRPAHVRLFTWGVGYDVNTWLLDTLAEEGRGQREYVKPKEDMEIKVSNFAGKIAAPVLSDVKLKIDGAEIHDLHPQAPGDLFAGSQLSILGRYDKPGKR